MATLPKDTAGDAAKALFNQHLIDIADLVQAVAWCVHVIGLKDADSPYRRRDTTGCVDFDRRMHKLEWALREAAAAKESTPQPAPMVPESPTASRGQDTDWYGIPHTIHARTVGELKKVLEGMPDTLPLLDGVKVQLTVQTDGPVKIPESPVPIPIKQFQEYTRKRVMSLLEKWQRLPEGPLVPHPMHDSDHEMHQEFSSPAYALTIRTGHELGYPKIPKAGDVLATVRDDIVFLAQGYLRLTAPKGDAT